MSKQPQSILLVEDEVVIACDIQEKLIELGYLVPAVARSGTSAVYLAGSLKPDIILMDIMLEGDMDGIEAARKIRAAFDIPIVYLSSLGNAEILKRARESDSYGYLLKPFQDLELIAAIETALNRHRIESELLLLKTMYGDILDYIMDGIWAADKGDLIYFVNRSMCRIAGIPAGEMIGRNASVVKDLAPLFAQVKESLQSLEYSLIPVCALGGKRSLQSGWLIPMVIKGQYNGMICTVNHVQWLTEENVS